MRRRNLLVFILCCFRWMFISKSVAFSVGRAGTTRISSRPVFEVSSPSLVSAIVWNRPIMDRSGTRINKDGAVLLSSTRLCLSSKPITWVIATIVGGTIGTPFVSSAKKSWYDRIPKPDWTPPNWIFAPVWVTLYSFMGYAASQVASTATATTTTCSLPLALYGVHYLLNISWAPIFFGMKRLRLGHILNIILISTLLPVIPLFYLLDKLAGILLLPYMAWLFVATALSDGICALNPTKKGYNNAMLEADIYKLQLAAANNVGII